MRILILSWRCPEHPLAGGAEQVTMEHAKAWVGAGHEVVWFASAFSGSRGEERREGVKIVRRGGELLGVYLLAPWFYFRTGPYDLVVDQFHGMPFFTSIWVRVSVLGFVHEVTREVWWLNHLGWPWRWVFGTVGYVIEPWVFRWFYRRVPFMVVSESTKKDLAAWGVPEGNVAVVQNGITGPAGGLRVKREEGPIVVFLGALARDKGIKEAIEVFKNVSREVEGARFWVVGKGEGDYVAKLRKEAAGLGKKIKFWGYVGEEEKFELLGRAWVMVNPSVREGWGLVNIEANIMGTPVVAYRSPGLVDSVKDGVSGMIVRKNNSGEMARVVIELLKDGERRRRLGRGAKKWARKFSWEQSSKESLDLIEKLVEGHA